MAVAVVESLFWQLGTCGSGRCRCREVVLAVGGHAVVAVAVLERFKLE